MNGARGRSVNDFVSTESTTKSASRNPSASAAAADSSSSGDVGARGELAGRRLEVAAAGEPAPVERGKGRRELGVLHEDALDVPVRGGPERHAVALALDHQAGGHALDPTGGAGTPGPAAGDERHLVPEQPIEHPTPLVRLDELHVELAPVLDRLLDRRPRDLVEDHALDRHLGRRLQQLEDVPGDRLALTILVRGEVELARVAEGLLQGPDVLLLLVGYDPNGLEVVVDVDAEPAHLLVGDALRDLLRAARRSRTWP